MYFKASFARIKYKIIRCDHTFKVASHVYTMHKNGSGSYTCDNPFAALLMTMNEDQQVGFFAFFSTKSMKEVEPHLMDLLHRDPHNPTQAVIIDSPTEESAFWDSIAPGIQVLRDVFHLFQDFFAECNAGTDVLRKRFMNALQHAFFQLDEGDIESYRVRLLRDHAAKNVGLENEPIKADEAWKKKSRSFNKLVDSHQV